MIPYESMPIKYNHNIFYRDERQNIGQFISEDIDSDTSIYFDNRVSIRTVVFDLSSEGIYQDVGVSIVPDFVENLKSKLKWLESFLQDSKTLDDVKSLLPYYTNIHLLIANKQFELCNDFLNCIQVTNLSNTLLIGLLRLTNTWRTKLPSWGILLMNAKEELEYRGYDSDNMLRGLSL